MIFCASLQSSKQSLKDKTAFWQLIPKTHDAQYLLVNKRAQGVCVPETVVEVAHRLQSLSTKTQRHLRSYFSAFPLVFMMVIDEHNGLETAHSYSTVVHLRGKYIEITGDVVVYRLNMQCYRTTPVSQVLVKSI